MGRSVLTLALLLAVVLASHGSVCGDEASSLRMSVLESRILALEGQVRNVPHEPVVDRTDGAALFLYGCFCALWAQNTNRNPWLWFFLGLFFSVFTAVVLLAKNAGDRQRARAKPAGFSPDV